MSFGQEYNDRSERAALEAAVKKKIDRGELAEVIADIVGRLPFPNATAASLAQKYKDQ